MGDRGRPLAFAGLREVDLAPDPGGRRARRGVGPVRVAGGGRHEERGRAPPACLRQRTAERFAAGVPLASSSRVKACTQTPAAAPGRRAPRAATRGVRGHDGGEQGVLVAPGPLREGAARSDPSRPGRPGRAAGQARRRRTRGGPAPAPGPEPGWSTSRRRPRLRKPPRSRAASRRVSRSSVSAPPATSRALGLAQHRGVEAGTGQLEPEQARPTMRPRTAPAARRSERASANRRRVTSASRQGRSAGRPQAARRPTSCSSSKIAPSAPGRSRRRSPLGMAARATAAVAAGTSPQGVGRKRHHRPPGSRRPCAPSRTPHRAPHRPRRSRQQRPRKAGSSPPRTSVRASSNSGGTSSAPDEPSGAARARPRSVRPGAGRRRSARRAYSIS